MDLAQAIRREGPLSPPQAVGWTLRLAKTLEQLHRRGVVHGAVCLEALQTVDRDCSAPAWLLGPKQVDQDPQYRSAERAENGRRSGADDVWAVGVVLYYAVTKAMPFSGETDVDVLSRIEWRPASPIEAYGCEAEDLQLLLDRLFARDRSKRITSAAGLRAALLQCIGADDELPPLRLATDNRQKAAAPAKPVPAAQPEKSSAPRAEPDKEIRPRPAEQDDERLEAVAAAEQAPARRGRKAKVSTTQWLVLAVIVVAVVVYATRRAHQPTRPSAGPTTSRTTPPPKTLPKAQRPASTTRRAAASSPEPRASASAAPATDAGAASTTADSAAPAEALVDRDACILQIFPEDTFAGLDPSFESLCTMTDPHKAALFMRGQAVQASRGRGVTKAMEEWAQIGWYDMAAVAVLQGLCCPRPAALSTPRVFAACQLDAALARVTAAGQARSRPALRHAVEGYTQAATCTAEGGGNALYGYGKLPSSADTITLVQMLARLSSIR